MQHGLGGQQPLGVVVSEQLVEEINGVGRRKPLIVRRDEARPRLPRVAPQLVVKVRREREVVFVEIRHQPVGPQHLGDLDELVVVVLALEEGFFLEDLRD
jgi:hypothetical protein